MLKGGFIYYHVHKSYGDLGKIERKQHSQLYCSGLVSTQGLYLHKQQCLGH